MSRRLPLTQRRQWLITDLIIAACIGLSIAQAQSNQTQLDQTKLIKRTILALYDGNIYTDPRDTPSHQLAQLPLNYLGLRVIYHNIHQPLPTIGTLANVRGIFWWHQRLTLHQPEKLLTWLSAAINARIRLVMWGRPTWLVDQQQHPLSTNLVKPLFRQLGLTYENSSTELTYQTKIIDKQTTLVEFERPLVGILPGFGHYRTLNKQVTSHLILQNNNQQTNDKNNSQSHVVVTGAQGGFADGEYIRYIDKHTQHQQWRLNPFAFFRLAFATDELPKPDPTTLSNRRIYFSHVNGDGWRERTKIHQYLKNSTTTAQVIFDEILTRFPHFPVTIAPIAGDLDPNWYGTPIHISIAKKIFALAQVEVGTHTYSHPFDWQTLQTQYTEQTSSDSTSTTSSTNSTKITKAMTRILNQLSPQQPLHKVATNSDANPRTMTELRTYHHLPFSLELEINHSVRYLNTLLPSPKSVTMIQWSGDNKPPLTAIALSQRTGLGNINTAIPVNNHIALFSYTTVAPYGIAMDQQYQVYSAATTMLTDNNLYTWQQYNQRTNTPRRLTALNLHYTMQSGQTLAGLNTLLAIHEQINTLAVIPVSTSHYAAIVDGFNQTQITQLNPQSWQIHHRGQLQTIRFDHAALMAVDFSASKGVIGQRHQQGRLYVLLDAAITTPIITLHTTKQVGYPPAKYAYLVQSNWQVSQVTSSKKNHLTFTAHGWGTSQMLWHMPQPGDWRIVIRSGQEVVDEFTTHTHASNLLQFQLPPMAIPITVSIEPNPIKQAISG